MATKGHSTEVTVTFEPLGLNQCECGAAQSQTFKPDIVTQRYELLSIHLRIVYQSPIPINRSIHQCK